MNIEPLHADLHLLDCRSRLPFRFGITTMTAAPLCVLRLEADTPNGKVTGYASDLLVPKWFVKNPDVPPTVDWLDLISGVHDALDAILPFDRHFSSATTVHRIWRAMDGHLLPGQGLLRAHGISMIERALIDAVCRSARVGIGQAVQSDLLGLSEGIPELPGWDPGPSLSRSRQSETFVRHTVGLADALTQGDIQPTDRVNDGLPECLAEDIERYGLRFFKVKIAGDQRVRERLADVGRVIAEFAGDEARVTLDANEQAASMTSLADALDDAATDPNASWLLDRVLYIEQPLPRSSSFDEEACRDVDRLSAHGGCIIDEADGSIDALPRAAQLGYRGVSVKNCKGVIRAIFNRGRCEMSGGALFQSGEDLTNLPVVALQQDLATMGLLGMPHVERNGHHYFDGLSFLPEADRREALVRHPDLYDATSGQLRIERGRLRFGSVLDCSGYGYDGPIALEKWTPDERWSPEALIGDTP